MGRCGQLLQGSIRDKLGMDRAKLNARERNTVLVWVAFGVGKTDQWS